MHTFSNREVIFNTQNLPPPPPPRTRDVVCPVYIGLISYVDQRLKEANTFVLGLESRTTNKLLNYDVSKLLRSSRAGPLCVRIRAGPMSIIDGQFLARQSLLYARLNTDKSWAQYGLYLSNILFSACGNVRS